jgi:hypothetical protein
MLAHMPHASDPIESSKLTLIPQTVKNLDQGADTSEESNSQDILEDGDFHQFGIFPEKLLTVPLHFATVTCDALVDTGATVSLIRESLVDPQLLLKDTNDFLVGLGGLRVPTLGSVLLDFQMGVVKLETCFVVVHDDQMRHSVVLGSSFFKPFGVAIDISRRRIAGHSPEGSWEVYLDSPSPYTVMTNVPIYTQKDVWVSRGEAHLVPVCVPEALIVEPDECYSFFFDGKIPGHRAQFLEGQPGLLRLEAGQTQILIQKSISGSQEKEKIPAGTKVGTIATIVDVQPVMEANVIKTPPVDFQSDIASMIEVDHLTSNEQHTVLSIMQQTPDVFSQGDHDVGCAGVTQHRIELHDDTPIRQKPRRFPEPVSNEIERQCEELRQLDIIDYSKSPWSSPIVPIKKKDGSIRLCIDYRQLNKVTKADRFPIPNMSDLVFGLHGMQYFTSLDLVKGYYQVPLHPDSAEYTAFNTSRNHYQFKRLSFGLKNAPGAFQREIQDVLKNFDSKQVVVYIDDVLIMSRTFSEHLDLVGKVLATFANYGIKIKPSKCNWFKKEVTFLGHVVGQSGLRKSDEYMDSVRKFPKPTTVQELRSFLGLINFQRKYISNCSTLCKPLTCLMGHPDKEKLLWTQEMDNSFQALKELMCENIELAYPDYSPGAAKLELSTDASGTGSGACLSQHQGDNVRVIAYASMTFSNAQRSYSTIERELAAIRWAVKLFRAFIYGVPFLLFTDHRPLVYMSNMSRQNARLMRTLNELGEYDFQVHYRAGKDNVIADTLSRVTSTPPLPATFPSPEVLPPGIDLLESVNGGGDSMVSSLLSVLHHQKNMDKCNFPLPTSTDDLRNVLVDEVSNHPELYNYKPDKSNKSALNLMRLPGNLPDERFLEAFSKLYCVSIWVHHGVAQPVIYGKVDCNRGTNSATRVHLQCLAGIHFNPLSERQNYQEPVLEEEVIHEVLFTDVQATSNGQIQDEVSACSHAEVLNLSCSADHGSSLPAQTTVRVGTQTYCALIDTGAQISVISEEAWLSVDFKKDGVGYEDAEIRIRSVGTSTTDASGIVSIDLQLVNTRTTLRASFVIVPAYSMPFCFILGADIIKSLNMKIDYHSMSYSFDVGHDRITYPLCSTHANSAHPDLCLAQEYVVPVVESYHSPPLLSLHQIHVVQQSNIVTRSLFGEVSANSAPVDWTDPCLKPFKRYASNLQVDNDTLWYAAEHGPVAVIPFPFLVELAVQLHWQMGHLGRNKLQNALRPIVWHPSLGEVCSDISTSCRICQLCKVSAQVKCPPMLKIQAAGPFDLVAADLIQLPKTGRGNIGCLVTVDHSSKWLNCVPIKNKKAPTIATALERHVLQVLPGKPNRILTDNGKEFTAEVFSEVLNKYGIAHVHSSPYKPSSNGAVERTNRTVGEMLRCLVHDSKTNWDEQLPRAVMVYNNSWHSQTKMTPVQYLLNCPHENLPSDLIDNGTKALWKEGHPSFSPFTVGDQVLRKVPLKGNECSNKLAPRFMGPYTVQLARDNGVTYEITRELQPDRSQTIKVHHSQIKKWIAPPDYLVHHPSFLVFQEEFDSFGQIHPSLDLGHSYVPDVYSSDDQSDSNSSQTFSTAESSTTNLDFSGFQNSHGPDVQSSLSQLVGDKSQTTAPDFSGFSTGNADRPQFYCTTSESDEVDHASDNIGKLESVNHSEPAIKQIPDFQCSSITSSKQLSLKDKCNIFESSVLLDDWEELLQDQCSLLEKLETIGSPQFSSTPIVGSNLREHVMPVDGPLPHLGTQSNLYPVNDFEGFGHSSRSYHHVNVPPTSSCSSGFISPLQPNFTGFSQPVSNHVQKLNEVLQKINIEQHLKRNLQYSKGLIAECKRRREVFIQSSGSSLAGLPSSGLVPFSKNNSSHS